MFWGKTIVYIDNSNIYRGGKDAGWLPEYEKLMRFLEQLGGQLWDVHFFAIEETGSERTSTSDFFDYLQKGLGFKLHLYTYGFKSIRCIHCGRFSQVTVEKGLDVGMATQIMRDFHNDAFDTMILMSANKDYVELMDFIRASGKKVKLLIWRNTMSQDLLDFTNRWGIEVIYLDDHRPDLEKEFRAARTADEPESDYDRARQAYRDRDDSRYPSDTERAKIADAEDDYPPRDRAGNGGGTSGGSTIERQKPPSSSPARNPYAEPDKQFSDEGTPLN